MARILLTGSKGFFGTRFIQLYKNQHTILGIDKDDVDILNTHELHRVCTQFRPELIIHAAAITSTEFSDTYPELTRDINITGAVHIAREARELRARLLFISTEQVFNGNSEPGPYAETHTPQPNTMYGATKLEAEQELIRIIDELWIVRFTWMFGLPEYNMPVNPNLMWNAVQITLRNTQSKVAAHEYRGYTYIYDMLPAILRIPELPYDLYHIGSQNNLSRYDLTCCILRGMGMEHRIHELIKPDDTKYTADSPRDARLNTSKLAKLGISFPDSKQAVLQCLRDFNLYNLYAEL